MKRKVTQTLLTLGLISALILGGCTPKDQDQEANPKTPIVEETSKEDKGTMEGGVTQEQPNEIDFTRYDNQVFSYDDAVAELEMLIANGQEGVSIMIETLDGTYELESAKGSNLLATTWYDKEISSAVIKFTEIED